jgi:hypothetical protein
LRRGLDIERIMSRLIASLQCELFYDD